MEVRTSTGFHLLCLLVGAFNLFAFKIIIDIYGPIIIFLIVLGLFSIGLFLLSCFLPTEVPLFIVNLLWWSLLLVCKALDFSIKSD